MGTKKLDEGAQKEQSARFIEAARQSGVDDSGKKFDKAFKKIMRKKKPSKS
jgi:hypothetical protein